MKCSLEFAVFLPLFNKNYSQQCFEFAASVVAAAAALLLSDFYACLGWVI